MSLLSKLSKDELIKLVENSQDTIKKLESENKKLKYEVVNSRCAVCNTIIDSDHLYSCQGEECPNRICECCDDEYCNKCQEAFPSESSN